MLSWVDRVSIYDLTNCMLACLPHSGKVKQEERERMWGNVFHLRISSEFCKSGKTLQLQPLEQKLPPFLSTTHGNNV